MSTPARAIPRDPIAPWAEVAPGAPPTTVQMLLSMADDGWIYEVVNGRLVRMAGSGQRATTIAARLLAHLFTFVEARGLGVVTGADGVYKFPHAETGLVPDVGFYLAERRALIVDPDKPIPFAPDLAVEVASPSQGQEDMDAKARMYLRGGTRAVWVIWPGTRTVDMWSRSPYSLLDTMSSVPAPGESVEGATVAAPDIVPGLSIQLADLLD